MPFSLRSYRRVPVQCAVTYNAGPFKGKGTVLARERTSGNVLDPRGSPCEKGMHLCVPPFRGASVKERAGS
jgi:hypothetical protein